MIIRIHDTDFDGNPVECTGEIFTGETALDIIFGMKMNPFNSHFEPVEYMRRTLDAIGQTKFVLPEDPDEAAAVFLQRLTVLGFASFEIDDEDMDLDHIEPVQPNHELKTPPPHS